jgi:translation initiation factor 5B
VVLAFNVNPLPEAEKMARDLNIKIFKNNIIYRLLEEYEEWVSKERERKELKKLETVVRPCRFRIIPGFVFRKRKPAVFGVEILSGVLKPNTPIQKEDGKSIRKVKKIEKEGKTVDMARTGDKVALSMDEPTIGRQINEGETLISVITMNNIKRLREIWNRLQDDEKQLLKEWNLV